MEYPKGYMTPAGIAEVKAASADVLAANALRRKQREAWATTEAAPLDLPPGFTPASTIEEAEQIINEGAQAYAQRPR